MTTEMSSAFCEYIDEFYGLCNASGIYSKIPVSKKTIGAVLKTPITIEEAKIIVGIYQEIYQGTYPYTEMLNVQWIHERFSDPNYIWAFFITNDQAPNPGEIAGCFTIVLDFEHKSGYFRGMMIRPPYQKVLAFRELSFSMFWHCLNKTHGRINKYYCESRTAHNITQYLPHIVGCNTHAILLNKDVFFHARESDALMVGYTRDAMEKDRLHPGRVHIKICGFFEYINKLHKFDESVIAVLPNLSLDPQKIESIVNHAVIEDQIDALGYHHLKIQAGSAQLTALYTPAIACVEKISLKYAEYHEFAALVKVLQQFITHQFVQYSEFYLPAFKAEEQQILLEMGYRFMGYVPAWIQDPLTQKFHDAVIMAQIISIDPEIPKKIQLLDQGYTLLKLILG